MVITPPWRKLLAVAGLAMAIGLTGCAGGGSTASGVASIKGGGSSTTTTAAGSGSGSAQGDAADQDAMVKFAQCMRQHGVDMPDPTASPNGGSGRAMAIPAGKAGDPAAMQKIQAASTACDRLLPNGGKPTNQDIQRSLKFAQCMRAHGVNMPDPNPNGGGVGITINESDPKTKAALSACMPTGTNK